MENIALLNEAITRYPKGTAFISVTGNLKAPLKITGLRMAENYKNVIVNCDGGWVYDGKNWAVKV
jgi:hypothetical protein